MKQSLRLDRRTLMAGAGSLLAALGVAKVTGGTSLFADEESASGKTLLTDKMPVVFVGHGSPMNAIADNAFTQAVSRIGAEVLRPRAILVVSAHWLTAGTFVTQMERPRTIHDFYGFPQALFDVRYPSPGDPELAKKIQSLSQKPKIQADESWGLDHGTWAVLTKMYPQADIPVLQLSIDMSESPEFHFELGKTLNSLRSQGVLIVGSGNIVHNLRRANWDMSLQGYDWNVEFDKWVQERLENRDYKPLVTDFMKTEAGRLSVPTPDHYYPLLYVLGAAEESDELQFHYEGVDLGSISMRTFTLGASSKIKS